jgi:hypothetical protein
VIQMADCRFSLLRDDNRRDNRRDSPTMRVLALRITRYNLLDYFSETALKEPTVDRVASVPSFTLAASSIIQTTTLPLIWNKF